MLREVVLRVNVRRTRCQRDCTVLWQRFMWVWLLGATCVLVLVVPHILDATDPPRTSIFEMQLVPTPSPQQRHQSQRHPSRDNPWDSQDSLSDIHSGSVASNDHKQQQQQEQQQQQQRRHQMGQQHSGVGTGLPSTYQRRAHTDISSVCGEKILLNPSLHCMVMKSAVGEQCCCAAAEQQQQQSGGGSSGPRGTTGGGAKNAGGLGGFPFLRGHKNQINSLGRRMLFDVASNRSLQALRQGTGGGGGSPFAAFASAGGDGGGGSAVSSGGNSSPDGSQQIAGLICLPSVMVIGAQKSGTTVLFSYLLTHPQFKAARFKEVRDRGGAHVCCVIARFFLGVCMMRQAANRTTDTTCTSAPESDLCCCCCCLMNKKLPKHLPSFLASFVGSCLRRCFPRHVCMSCMYYYHMVCMQLHFFDRPADYQKPNAIQSYMKKLPTLNRSQVGKLVLFPLCRHLCSHAVKR